MNKLVLIRHGQSQWNLENRFTGWEDVGLSDNGREEAKKAGELFKRESLCFQRAYTSYLKRAIHTLWIVLEESDLSWIPVTKSWQLNERHYGELQGLNKKQVKEKYGETRFFQWRRGYETPPPPIERSQNSLLKDRRYEKVEIPRGESLRQTQERVVFYWNRVILDQMKEDLSKDRDSLNTLVVAHGNSLRALVKYLTGMDEEEIMKFEFITGTPLVCELGDQFKIKKMDWMLHDDGLRDAHAD